jgi:hypothetical protein
MFIGINYVNKSYFIVKKKKKILTQLPLELHLDWVKLTSSPSPTLGPSKEATNV